MEISQIRQKFNFNAQLNQLFFSNKEDEQNVSLIFGYYVYQQQYDDHNYIQKFYQEFVQLKICENKNFNSNFYLALENARFQEVIQGQNGVSFMYQLRGLTLKIEQNEDNKLESFIKSFQNEFVSNWQLQRGVFKIQYKNNVAIDQSGLTRDFNSYINSMVQKYFNDIVVYGYEKKYMINLDLILETQKQRQRIIDFTDLILILLQQAELSCVPIQEELLAFLFCEDNSYEGLYTNDFYFGDVDRETVKYCRNDVYQDKLLIQIKSIVQHRIQQWNEKFNTCYNYSQSFIRFKLQSSGIPYINTQYIIDNIQYYYQDEQKQYFEWKKNEQWHNEYCVIIRQSIEEYIKNCNDKQEKLRDFLTLICGNYMYLLYGNITIIFTQSILFEVSTCNKTLKFPIKTQDYKDKKEIMEFIDSQVNIKSDFNTY